MGWITKITSPFTGGLSGVYIYVILFLTGVGSGLYVGHVWTGYKENAAKKEIAVEVKRVDKIDTNIAVQHEADVNALAANYQTLEKEYEKLKSKKPVVTSDCKLTVDAVRVWDKSSSEGVPKDTKAIASEASKATDTPTATVEGVSIEDAISNKLEWDNYCHQLEEKLDAIIQWDKEVEK